MPEIITCPKCRKLFSIALGQQGQGATCPFCRQPLVVPPQQHTGSDVPLVRPVPFPGLMLVWLLPAFVSGFISILTTLAAPAIVLPNQPDMFFVFACGSIIAVLVQLLLCIFLLRGDRLARQATMVLCCAWLLLTIASFLAGVVLLLIFWRTAWSHLSATDQVMPLSVLVLGELIHAGLVVALLVNLTSAPGTLRYFGLVCPSCGNLGGMPIDLLFKNIRCPSCRREWRG